MPRFPRSAAGITGLAKELIQGLARLTEDLPAPPFSFSQLRQLLEAYEKARHEAREARTLALNKRAAKDAALNELIEATKAVLGYAMSMLRGKRTLLIHLGWDWPRSRRALQGPGQVLNLQIIAEGRTWIEIGWSAPLDGGAVATYQVQRRQAVGPWETVQVVTDLSCRLENQPRGVQLEFQVFAINKAGSGITSGVVEAVL